jgi:hypothetical protein
LLVEVGHSVGNAPVLHIPDPSRVTAPVSRAALTPGDNPVEAIKTELVHRTKQRFGADEADGRRNSTQIVVAPRIVV